MEQNVPTLPERLNFLRTCTAAEISELLAHLSLGFELPGGFLDSLDENDKTTCRRAMAICYCVTEGKIIPREMQLRAVLADRHGQDSLIAAGTGSGKTLPMALNILLDDPAMQFTTITLSPLKRLQATQKNDFIDRFGIPTEVINEDTSSESSWWKVRRRAQQFNVSLTKPVAKRIQFKYTDAWHSKTPYSYCRTTVQVSCRASSTTLYPPSQSVFSKANCQSQCR
jgi:hypothetical protein